ncbi:Ig-like domain-containing protein [uncultured Nocardioides sp.]|uniref:Ig-like domain-containing protein n=2 Tax=uncultured Nocardioides sp. TaxID=198441 RepID=UPI002606C8D4|nr:Ig-like domain-containing protein [uncultured Nocardioides sp.]
MLPLLAALAAPAALPTIAASAAPGTSTVSAAGIATTVIRTVDDVSELPDPLDRGDYTAATIQETKLGTVALQEPNSSGAAPEAGSSQAAEDIEIRGALYYPADREEPSPLVVLVHGNHGSCDSGTDRTNLTCDEFKRNEAGYAYLGENLATWGYTTFSVSQDQMMMRQDGAKGKGMHQRRLLIAATLDALSAANEAGGLPDDEHTTIGDTLAGSLDLTRIGLMGHSRGGDAVTSFIDYNRIRTDGPRYPLRGVISLAPVDYERKAPYGTPYMSILPWCDGDVSNLQGARFFERSQYVNGDDPFPRIQSSQLGANHNWYNSVWFADGQDGTNTADAACGNSQPSNDGNVQPHNLRLSGAASYDPPSYVIDNSATFDPEVNTKISGDADRMGDQEKIGLATMSAFFRRYVGGEGAFDGYMTGELSDTASHLQIPESACPTSESGTAIACKERVSTSYFPPATERVDVIRPEITNPLGLNALGGSLSGSGFAYPYLDNGAVDLPKQTSGGYDWCNPEPEDFAPSQLGKGNQPTAAKPCPLPGKAELGGQSSTRENAPINHSYGRQLALAWEEGRTAELTAQIPAASRDLSGLEALAMGADVNFFDPRNPGFDEDRLDDEGNALPVAYDPETTTQDFLIVLSDTEGNEAVVHAGDERWGNALHASTGTITSRTHVVLDQIRVPLSEFADQGVDLTSLASVSLRFGEEGTPASGSVQVADVRFQEAASEEPLILSDGTAPDQGAGYGAPATGPDPAEFLASYDNTPGALSLIDQVDDPFNNTVWTVDDDSVQCPDAQFDSVQDAVDFASPWDTIVVCDGTYEESSTPVFGAGNPVATGARNGLTITKPLKIKGAGADRVTIMPDQGIESLAGLEPYLRDGGGNVVTVSRQSLGSTDTNEMFVDLSGVTVTSGSTYAEAGIAFFGAAGRVSESVVGPMAVAADDDELALQPHGWGIVKTGVILGDGPGTVESEVTVADSLVTGYQSGGILFDGARGPDGDADNTVRTGIRQHGYVVDTVVTGKPNRRYAQTGIAYTSGVDGFVENSRVTGNYYKPAPSQSFGILLTDAGTEGGDLSVDGSILTGNGFAVYNANADNTGVREGAPITVSSSFLGQGSPVEGGPADPSAGTEAVSGRDSENDPTVIVSRRASTPPTGVPVREGRIADEAPYAELIDPVDGSEVAVGETVLPLVRGLDDVGVRSVTLVVDGQGVGDATSAPYAFAWAPGPELAGKEVTLTAIVTDSAGQATASESMTLRVTEEVVDPELVVDKVKVRHRKGTAVVTASLNTAGELVVTGGKLKTVSTTAEAADAVKLTLTPTASQRRKLADKGRLVVRATLTFTALTGGEAVEKLKVVLRKK